jgi:hypothetical protein
MKGIALLLRIPHPPAFDPDPAFLDLFDHTFDIDEGVPGKYVGESIGKAADQAFARPFDQVEGQYDSFLIGGNEFQPDVIGAFFCIPVKGFKKFIACLQRQKGVQIVLSKQALLYGMAHDIFYPFLISSLKHKVFL